MLKEQVAEILNDIPCKRYKCDFWDVQGNYCYANSADKNASYDCLMAEAVFNLFKAEVDKLTVVHADDCTTNLGIIGATCNCGSETQLQHTKRQLLRVSYET